MSTPAAGTPPWGPLPTRTRRPARRRLPQPLRLLATQERNAVRLEVLADAAAEQRPDGLCGPAALLVRHRPLVGMREQRELVAAQTDRLAGDLGRLVAGQEDDD